MEETRSSDESDNSSTESLHIKSKVAKASSRQKKINMEDFFEEARYFVMKSNNHENVALSKAKVQVCFSLQVLMCVSIHLWLLLLLVAARGGGGGRLFNF